MCGNREAVFNAEIEGSLLAVCESCSVHGDVKSRIRVVEEKPKKKVVAAQPASIAVEEDATEIINKDYASLVKKARESRGLKQGELAKALREKESVIHNVESGRMLPSIPLARKLEKYFKIRLVEEYREKPGAKPVGGGQGSLTLGDIANVKKRKK